MSCKGAVVSTVNGLGLNSSVRSSSGALPQAETNSSRIKSHCGRKKVIIFLGGVIGRL